MNLLRYVERLLPVVGKKDVFGELEKVIAEFDKVVLPTFEASTKEKLLEYKDPELVRLSRILKKYLKGNNAPLHVVLFRYLKRVRENILYIDSNFDKIFEGDVLTKEADTVEAMTIRLIEHCVFITHYSMELLNYIYERELSVILPSDADGIGTIPRITVKQINAHASTYGLLVSSYGIDKERFIKEFDSIPVFKLSATADRVVHEVIKDRVDPFLPSNYSGFVHSIIFYIRLNYAVAANARYEAMRHRKSVAEFRLLHLKNLNAGENSPKIAERIESLQKEINTYEQLIKKEEDAVKYKTPGLESEYSYRAKVDTVLDRRTLTCEGGSNAYYT